MFIVFTSIKKHSKKIIFVLLVNMQLAERIQKKFVKLHK